MVEQSIRAAQPRRRPRSLWLWVAGAVAVLSLALTALAAAAGFFDGDPVHVYGMDGAQHPRIAAAYFSGDMGLRFGMGTHVVPALAARGIPVYGISSPAIFNRQRSQGEVDALIARTVRDALARSRADRLILMGQSFGSDIVVAGLAALPADLRAKIAAVVLVVPGRTAYFRADPSGLRYHGTPDADLAADARSIHWAPLICIYGQSESESLCPTLIGTPAKVIELPGGHFLRNDHERLVAAILTGLGPVLQTNSEQAK